MQADPLKQVERLQPPIVMIELADSEVKALELCRRIRETNSSARMAVILLAKNTSEEDRTLGLEAGADDYITEAASGRGGSARARRIAPLGAAYGSSGGCQGLWLLSAFLDRSARSHHIRGKIELDPTVMIISVWGSQIVTTNLEFRLLYCLAHNQKRVFSRNQLLDVVWGAQNVELRAWMHASAAFAAKSRPTHCIRNI